MPIFQLFAPAQSPALYLVRSDMKLFIHFVSSVTPAEETGVVQQSVLFYQRHAARNDIDIVADCQIDKAVTDFLGILGQPTDSL